MTTSKPVLEVQNLVKTFGEFKAVDGISFDVPKGRIIGLLGPNGAGKTTTIHMLLGITTMTSGNILYFGKDFKTHQRQSLSRINFTSSFNTLQGRISVAENLIVFAGLYEVKNPMKKIDELLRVFEIEDLKHKRYQDLSSGQRSRVNIIKSMINDPELILMDEPTASLDPDIADKLIGYIEHLRQERGISILFTSHDMHEVSRLCDEVIFMSHGKIVAQDTPSNLSKTISNAKVTLLYQDGNKTITNYLRDKGFDHKKIDHRTVEVEVEEKLVPKLIFGISKTGVMIDEIEIKKPDLEDVFLQIARKQHHVTT